MTEIVYNRGKTRIFAGDTPLDTGDIRIGIVTGTTVGADDPDLNTVADLDAVPGVGIHSERIALTGKTVTQDNANNRVNADANGVIFAVAPGVTALAAIIYDEGGGTDATRELISFHDTTFPQSMDGGMTVNINNDWLRGI